MKLKNLLLFCCIFFFFATKAQQHLATTPRPFITTWNTAASGVSDKNQISFNATGNNFTISWVNMNNANDTGSQTANAGVVTITFATQGIYKVYITPGSGTFSAITLITDNDEVGDPIGDGDKLLSIEQWGDIQWTTFNNAFYECQNMVLNAADKPNLSNVTDLSGMFIYCRLLTTNAAMSNWNISHITDMSYMFQDTRFNQSISGWDVSNVNNMGGMFLGADSFNQPIGNWDVSKVTSMVGMFGGTGSFNQPIGNWNVSNVTDMAYMFEYARAFNQPIGNWDVSKVTNMYYMFEDAYSFNQPLNNWNVSKVTRMDYMFSGTDFFLEHKGGNTFNQYIGSWNLSGVLSMDFMLDSSGMDCSHYSQTLKGWANNINTPNGLGLGAAGLIYDSTFAQVAHDSLTNLKGWIIDDSAGHCSVILPVNFISFTAIQQGNSAQLNWKVAKQINAKGYDVEKSVNGYNYNAIGFVNADGKQTDYAYTDNNLADGTSYYRIKEIDNDGKYMYSSIQKLSYSKFAWKINGNPINNSSVSLILNKPANVSIQVVSSNGNVIKTIQKGKLVSGNYNIPLNIDNISSGLYLVRLMVDDKAYASTVVK